MTAKKKPVNNVEIWTLHECVQEICKTLNRFEAETGIRADVLILPISMRSSGKFVEECARGFGTLVVYGQVRQWQAARSL